MANILDIFKGDAFNVVELTEAMNNLPYKPKRIGQLGLFAPKGVTTRSIIIEERDGVLQLLVSQPWGAPAPVSKKQDRRARSFTIPHFPLCDTVMASEVQGVRAFGSATETEAVAQVVNDKLAVMRSAHEITLEWLRAGAIKGVVFDGDLESVLIDLYKEYNVSKQADVNHILGTDGTSQKSLCLGIVRTIEEALGEIGYDHIHALCGKDWFDAFVEHPTVKAAYERYQDGAFLREDQRSGFPFAGIVFEEYRGKIGSQSFIADDEVRYFPVGAPGLFQTIYAPADYIETVNTVGLPFYAKQQMMDFDKGINIETQSNPLCICTRPRTLIRGYTSN